MNVVLNILFTIVGGIAGYFTSKKISDESEKKIIDTLTLEIKALQDKLTTGRSTTGTEQAEINGLTKALNIIKNK